MPHFLVHHEITLLKVYLVEAEHEDAIHIKGEKHWKLQYTKRLKSKYQPTIPLNKEELAQWKKANRK